MGLINGFGQQATASMQPLPAESAFKLAVSLDTKQHLTLAWRIAPGYYLYKDRLHLRLNSQSQIQLGAYAWPAGQLHQKGQGKTEIIYRDQLVLVIPLVADQMHRQLSLDIKYQGCAEMGLCYVPIHKQLNVNLINIHDVGTLTPFLVDVSNLFRQDTDPDTATALLKYYNPWLAMLGFLGLGLLLAFTPCVLPMLPIVTAIIAGQTQHPNKKRGFLLSLAYVLGMALTYAMLGSLVAILGGSVQAFLQQPAVIIGFSLLIVCMALSLFGIYELQLPSHWLQWLTRLNRHLQGGSYVGALFMGCLATLVLSPCVTAPLVGVLAYIAQTGHWWLGGGALFAIGIGMGIPLLLIGLSAKRFLPKAGAWMQGIKSLLGIVLLGLAISTIARILSNQMVLMLWAFLYMGTAILLGTVITVRKPIHWLMRGLSFLVFCYGIAVLVEAASGYPYLDNLFHAKEAMVVFEPVQKMTSVKQALTEAKQQHRPLLLDFYADWCVSCVDMDRKIFTSREVKQQLVVHHYRLLRVDLTHTLMDSESIRQYFQVIAPPTIVFFDPDGKEQSQRIIGEVSRSVFLAQLSGIVAAW